MNALAPRPRSALLEVEGLSVRFPQTDQPVVDQVSFSIDHGECLALIGESGSGKSVTSRSLIGLAGPGAHVAANRLSFNGQDLRGLSPKAWTTLRGRQIGFVMQDALGSLDPLRRVGEDVGEALKLHTNLDRKAREAKVLDLLRSAGIADAELRAANYPSQLSGGLRQRALIASAIACDPQLLIADEPTTALDAVVQAQVLRLLESLRTPDNAMLVVSHDFGVVAALADTVAVMRRGVIVEYGSAAAVLEDPQHPYTRDLLAAANALHGSRLRAAVARPTWVAAPANDQAPVVEARAISKSFHSPDARKRTAVADVSFQLRRGETLGIVGESGSGKTTIKRIVLGLEAPDEGEVELGGKPWSTLPDKDRRAARKRIQAVFQDPLGSFDPRYTVERVLNEAIELTGRRGRARRERAVELLHLVRLDESYLSRRPLEMSGGQRQRLAIARALAPEPDVLLCDEPVSALDVSVQVQILDLLADLKQRLGLSCIFISHDLGVIERVSDRIVVLRYGRIVEQGDAADVLRRPQDTYTRELISAIPDLQTKAPAHA
jgi:peptide/nickel transport system ATP-binding protein